MKSMHTLLITAATFAAVITTMSPVHAEVRTSVTSNQCSGDRSMRLNEFAHEGNRHFYAAWSDESFELDATCEIKLQVNVPAGRRLKLHSARARGRVALFGRGARALIGMSVRSADGKAYTGGNTGFLSETQKFELEASSDRGATECGRDTQLIIRFDRTAEPARNVNIDVEYFAFYADSVPCR